MRRAHLSRFRLPCLAVVSWEAVSRFPYGAPTKGLVDFGCLRRKVAAISTAHSELGAVRGSWVKGSLPLVGAWEQCLDRGFDAAREAVAKGLSLALGYLRKAARVSFAALHDRSAKVEAQRADSKDNLATFWPNP